MKYRYFILGIIFGFFGVTAKAEPFTLRDAVHLALETTYAKNAKLMGGVVQLNRDIEESIYQPEYLVELKGASDQSEKGNPFIPDTEVYGLQLGVDQTFKTGTELSIRGNVSSQSQLFETFDDVEYFETFVRVGIEQDIWRNAFGVMDRANLKKLDLEKEIALADITDLLEETVYQATAIFWTLALSERQIDVAKKAVANAKVIYDREVRNARTGLSESRIVEAVRANLLNRQVAYDEAVANYETVKDQFLTILDITEMPEISDNADVLVSVVTGNSFTYDWGRQSRQLRRYQSALLLKDTRDIDILKALDKTKPKLVVFAGAGFNGIDEDLGASMGDFSSFNHLLVEGGVRLTLPGGKEPLYSVKRAQLERAIQDNNIELLTEESQLELKRSSRQVKLLKSVMDNRLMISESLSRKYQEDLRQFDIGRLSIDVLIESEDRHLEAQLLAIQSKYQYLQAICRHFRVDNTLLSKIAFIKEGK